MEEEMRRLLVEVDGDTAFAEHYGIAYHRLPAGDDGLEKDWIATIRYIDRFERRGGEWRIAHRRSIVDSDRVDVVSETLVPRGTMARSRRRPATLRSNRHRPECPHR